MNRPGFVGDSISQCGQGNTLLKNRGLKVLLEAKSEKRVRSNIPTRNDKDRMGYRAVLVQKDSYLLELSRYVVNISGFTI